MCDCRQPNIQADAIEPVVCEFVRGLLADPEREVWMWSEKLAEAGRKRVRYQEMAAASLITFDELNTRRRPFRRTWMPYPERNRLYRMLRLEITPSEDGSYKVQGAFCTGEPLSGQRSTPTWSPSSTTQGTSSGSSIRSWKSGTACCWRAP